MKKMAMIVMLAAAILVLVACGGGNPVVGTWVYSDENIELISAVGDEGVVEQFKNMTYEFTKDGKLIVTSGDNVVENDYTIEGDVVTIDGGGETAELKLEGDSLMADGESFLVRK